MQICGLAPSHTGREPTKAEPRAPIVGRRQTQHTRPFTIGASLPAGIKYGNTVTALVEDAQGHIYVQPYGPCHQREFRLYGGLRRKRVSFVKSWGKDLRGGPTGLAHPEGRAAPNSLYLCEHGARGIRYEGHAGRRSRLHPGIPDESAAYKPGPDGKEPKYSPTNLAILTNGDLYVAMATAPVTLTSTTARAEYIRTFGGKGKEAGKLD